LKFEIYLPMKKTLGLEAEATNQILDSEFNQCNNCNNHWMLSS